MYRNGRSAVIHVLVGLVATALIETMQPVRGDPVPPFSAGSNGANPFWRFAVRGPIGAPVTLYPTNNGQRILNPDGQQVRSVGHLLGPAGAREFSVPGLINGLPTNDGESIVGDVNDPLDPGVTRFAVFTGGLMDPTSLGNWLSVHRYDFETGTELVMPGFLPGAGAGFSTVYMGVNLAALGSSGSTFVASHTLGDLLTVNGLGGIDGLSSYVFSSTPLSYLPGTGWGGGTPLAPGTVLRYDHITAVGVPEPGSGVLLAAGLAGGAAWSGWRRHVGARRGAPRRARPAVERPRAGPRMARPHGGRGISHFVRA